MNRFGIILRGLVAETETPIRLTKTGKQELRSAIDAVLDMADEAEGKTITRRPPRVYEC